MYPMTLLAIGLCAAASMGHASAQTAQNADHPGWHMESVVAGTYEASFSARFSYPKFTASQWILVMPACPELPCQHVASMTMIVPGSSVAAKDMVEQAPFGRTIMMIVLPVTGPSSQFSNTVNVAADYDVTTYARRIMPGDPPQPIAPLCATDRAIWLSPSKTCDFSNPYFQQFLISNHLAIGASETPFEFAYRAFRFIKRKYHYDYDATQDRTSSKICQEDKTDCGGLSCLYASILRANGIPARQLVGRWALSETSGEFAQQTHVKAEFYLSGVGWVPVDLTAALGAPDSQDATAFGFDSGKFITQAAGTDLSVDTGVFGVQTITFGQGVVPWLEGTGPLIGGIHDEHWRVRTVGEKN
jgi:transglutaminase-like putative cysteine protease